MRPHPKMRPFKHRKESDRMTTQRIEALENDLDNVKTILAAAARHAESGHEAFEKLTLRLDEYIFQSQRLINGHEDRIISAQGSAERLEAVFAMQQRQMERLEISLNRLEQNQNLLGQNHNSLEQNHNLLIQMQVQQQSQINKMDDTQRSTHAAIDQIGSILNQLLKQNPPQ